MTSSSVYQILTADSVAAFDLEPRLTTEDRQKFLKAWYAFNSLLELNLIDELEAHDPTGTSYMSSEYHKQRCKEAEVYGEEDEEQRTPQLSPLLAAGSTKGLAA